MSELGKRSKIESEIFKSLFCSITHQIMFNPVVASDGYTYEREAIEEWLKTHDTSPKTGLVLENKNLLPNRDKKSDTDELLEQHPELYDGDQVYFSKGLQEQLFQAVINNNIEEINQISSLDKRVLTRVLTIKIAEGKNLLSLASTSTLDVFHCVLNLIGKSDIWGLPEIRNIKTDPKFFNNVALNLGIPGVTLILELISRNQQEQLDYVQKRLEDSITNGNSVIAEVCLDLGATLTKPNQTGTLPLQQAQYFGHQALMQLLLRYNAVPIAIPLVEEERQYSAEINRRRYTFAEHAITGEGASGNCGFTAIGIDRDVAVQLLLDNSANLEIRQIVGLEIKETLNDVDGSLPPEVRTEGEQLRNRRDEDRVAYDRDVTSLREEYEVDGTDAELMQRFHDTPKEPKNIAIYNEMVRLRAKHKDLFVVEREIEEYCNREDVYRAFASSYHSSNGSKWLTFLPQNEGGIVDALAKLRNFNVCIWDRRAGTNILESMHSYGGLTGGAMHILHTGGGTHFNFLEVIKVEPLDVKVTPVVSLQETPVVPQPISAQTAPLPKRARENPAAIAQEEEKLRMEREIQEKAEALARQEAIIAELQSQFQAEVQAHQVAETARQVAEAEITRQATEAQAEVTRQAARQAEAARLQAAQVAAAQHHVAPPPLIIPQQIVQANKPRSPRLFSYLRK